MSLITLVDVRNAIPTIAITPTSQPSDAQVTEYAMGVEGELRAAMSTAGATWPSAGQDAYTWLQGAALDGVIYRVLRAKYALDPSGAELIDSARTTWNTRLAEIRRSGLAVSQTAGANSAPVHNGPVYVNPIDSPSRAGSFGEWSEAGATRDSYRSWGTVFRP